MNRYDNVFTEDVMAEIVLFSRVELAKWDERATGLITHPRIIDGYQYKTPIPPSNPRYGN
jgi:hypothetical protein